jgi:hypothetical protein
MGGGFTLVLATAAWGCRRGVERRGGVPTPWVADEVRDDGPGDALPPGDDHGQLHVELLHALGEVPHRQAQDRRQAVVVGADTEACAGRDEVRAAVRRCWPAALRSGCGALASGFPPDGQHTRATSRWLRTVGRPPSVDIRSTLAGGDGRLAERVSACRRWGPARRQGLDVDCLKEVRRRCSLVAHDPYRGDLRSTPVAVTSHPPRAPSDLQLGGVAPAWARGLLAVSCPGQRRCDPSRGAEQVNGQVT